jgi:hypothetical protein
VGDQSLFALVLQRVLGESCDCESFCGGLDIGRSGFLGNCWFCLSRCGGYLRFCRIRI